MIISVIGAGVIGSAVAKALVASSGKNRIIASDKRVEQLSKLEKEGVETTTDNKKAAKTADIIILCVKPSDMRTVLSEIRNEVKEKLVISMAAAVNLELLKKCAPQAKIIRAMPNLAIIVRESFTAYCPERDFSSKDREIVESILRSFGTVSVVEEDKMDAVTALSGCAPGYLSSLMELIVQGGTEIGLPTELALTALAQSMIGTGKIILETKKSPADVMKMVATPGGVTEEELSELSKYPLQKAFRSTLQAGVEKSRKITNKLLNECQ
ncbi:pyrroline-5-carboxylate reductase [Candidatus Bathyarchaeota archaeon]|nr:pyrroline-5-carboxylate reductase [Candidatus Bathyarchaeota archaeon]